MAKINHLIFLLIFVHCNLFSQSDTNRIKKDSLIVINIYNYDLSNGGISRFKRSCINQKTFNTDKVLLREIIYADSNNNGKLQISDLVYYFYFPDQSLKSKEFYSPDGKLKKAIRYNYNDKGNIEIKTNYQYNHDKLVFIGDTTYKYKKDKLARITVRNSERKKTLITNVQYNQNDIIYDQIYNQKLSSRVEPQEQIITVHKENNKEVSRQLVQLFSDNQSDTTKIDYKYDADGQLVEKLTKSETGNFKEVYIYYDEGFIKNITTTDQSGKKIKFLTYDLDKFIRIFGGLPSVFK